MPSMLKVEIDGRPSLDGGEPASGVAPGPPTIGRYPLPPIGCARGRVRSRPPITHPRACDVARLSPASVGTLPTPNPKVRLARVVGALNFVGFSVILCPFSSLGAFETLKIFGPSGAGLSPRTSPRRARQRTTGGGAPRYRVAQG